MYNTQKVTFDHVKGFPRLPTYTYIYIYIYEDIHSTFCYMFDLQAQAADLVTLKARLTASEEEVKDLHTENSGNDEHSFKTIMEINVVELIHASFCMRSHGNQTKYR